MRRLRFVQWYNDCKEWKNHMERDHQQKENEEEGDSVESRFVQLDERIKKYLAGRTKKSKKENHRLKEERRFKEKMEINRYKQPFIVKWLTAN